MDHPRPEEASPDSDFDQLQPADSDLEILSTLNSEVALERLAEVEALIASTADALFTVDQGEAADFAAYVWFVLSAQERLVAVAADADLAGAIDGLLAFVQLPPAIAARWKVLAEYVREQYEATPAESRLRWTLTGTTLASARRIEQIASPSPNRPRRCSVSSTSTETPAPSCGR